MYRLLRNTHLVLGLLLFWVVLMYGVSAAQMAHRVRIEQVVTERDVSAAAGLEARPLANLLMEREGLGGEMSAVTSRPGGYRFQFTRAGGNTVIQYDSATGKVHFRETQTGMLGVLNRLHHFHGLHNHTGRRNAWGWLVLFASLGLLALGATGIYLWFKLHTERVAGSLLLAANLVVSVALLIALRAA
ncbi:MAG: PepSY-associated TM helix domain-containing protein [Candidatus Solibacter sp.]